MPGTKKQNRAACGELGRRQKGEAPAKGRPFGTAKKKALKDFCRGPK